METARLRLRRPGESDFSCLFELDNDPEVMRWINGGVPVDEATWREQLMPVYLDATDALHGFWLAESQATGDFVGWVSLIAAGPGESSLGYRLSRSAWGQGLATEMAEKLLRAASEAGLQRVTATTYEENLGSRRVLEKLGMQLVKRFRLTEEALAASTTSVVTGDVWDGDELLFEILLG